MDLSLKPKIKSIFVSSKSSYGARRIRLSLLSQDIVISRRRVARLMKELHLFAKQRRAYKNTTNSSHKNRISPNILNRDFKAPFPNYAWVGDITYIRVRGGFLYLSIVLDLYSRKIVGWSLRDNMQSDLVNSALLSAIYRRRPSRGLIWHTDRGSQYASSSHRRIINKYGLRQSMSRKANAWDNAVAESFFGTLKTELDLKNKLQTREQIKKIIFEYIEVFYNRKRAHSAIGYSSPDKHEEIFFYNNIKSDNDLRIKK